MNASDRKMALFAASINPKLPIIDLHAAGDLVTALHQLDRGLDKVMQTDARACRVIYGLGEGILAREVLKNLQRHPYVLDLQEEESGGSCVVIL